MRVTESWESLRHHSSKTRFDSQITRSKLGNTSSLLHMKYARCGRMRGTTTQTITIKTDCNVCDNHFGPPFLPPTGEDVPLRDCI